VGLLTIARRLCASARAGHLGTGISLRLRQLKYKPLPACSSAQIRRYVERAFLQSCIFYIDVISSCNLRCPSCPIANWPKGFWTEGKGLMEPGLLNRIIRKALSECSVRCVNLYAYSEPLLHPRLPELIRVVKSYRLRCGVSTSLNVLREPDALLEAAPDEIVISVSGFYQHNYGITHAGGDIEVVKHNMIVLADAKRRLAAKTEIAVYFHKYLTNAEDLPLMKHFAESLGFKFEDSWAIMMPLEKVWAYVYPDTALAEMTDTDREIVDRIAIPLHDVLEVASRGPVNSCSLQNGEVVLDVAGNAYLCCASAMDGKRNKLAPFLDTSLGDLQRLKRSHSLCRRCMAGGLPPVMTSTFDLPYIHALVEKRCQERKAINRAPIPKV